MSTPYLYRNAPNVPQGEGICWRCDGNVLWMPVKVIDQPAVWLEGEEPELLQAEVLREGDWIVAVTEGETPPLPDPVSWADVADCTVSPSIAGLEYPAS